MSFLSDLVHPQESLRLLDLLASGGAQLDILMAILSAVPDTTTATGRSSHSPFLVARKSDVASATIAQLFFNNTSKMTVTISVYKTGGDTTIQEAGTPLEFVM